MRLFLILLVSGSAAVLTGRDPEPGRQKSFPVAEATIQQMAEAMREGRLTSRALVTEYLTRIALHEERLNAVISVNPHALAEADRLDGERAQNKVRGPLHGIPIALKDNIHTIEMPTTGGALAFSGFTPPYEATLTTNLRDAGAIIIAKTVLTELAGAMADMPGNYSAVGGYGFNPYDLRRDPRRATFGQPALPPAGSSSGSGTSANFWAASVGTETSGSILGPAFLTMLVGIKPTVGRISRYGIIPFSADQDTAGPMARTVVDAALLLGVLEGAASDANDPLTGKCTRPPGGDYTRFLNPGGLKGARIGIPRAFFYEAARPPDGGGRRGGLNPDQARLMDAAITVLKQHGTTIVDPADVPSVVEPNRQRSFLTWKHCEASMRAKGTRCSIVMDYGLKRDFTAWLASLGPAAPVKTLSELRKWNTAHKHAGALKYGQTGLDAADGIQLEKDRARYEADRRKDLELSVTHGIEQVMKVQRLDALLFPMSRGAALAAPGGFPTIVVPFGSVPHSAKPPFPPDFAPPPWPFGVSFTGAVCSEPRLVELAFAFEHATRARVPPRDPN